MPDHPLAPTRPADALPPVDPGIDATVIICTRNRSASLANVCESVKQVELPGGTWELVIVDNGSTDDTLEVARAFAARNPRLARVIEAPKPGLSAARNAGVRAARGGIIAFLDDDAFPETAWLMAVTDALRGPGVLAAGGPVEPLFRGTLPDWLHAAFLPYLTVWDLGQETRSLTYNEYPRGANMAFRREVFERFGLFSTHLGRKGRSLLSCEELELCLRIERGGGEILYVPAARVRHVTVAARLTRSWLKARFGSQGRSEAIVNWMHGASRGLWKGFVRFGKNAIHAMRARGSDPLMAGCQLHAFAGYVRGALAAPWRVPRYRAPENEAVLSWDPP